MAKLIPNKYEAPDIERAVEAYLDGVKDKHGKPRLSLLLPRVWVAFVRIREYGLKKYPDAENYKKVPVEDWADAALRHFAKWIAGERIDEESGYPHMWHILVNVGYIIEAEWESGLW